jgi:hypothetical protein
MRRDFAAPRSVATAVWVALEVPLALLAGCAVFAASLRFREGEAA